MAQEETKSVNSLVLSFGLGSLILVIAIVCGTMALFLYSMSIQLKDQSTRNVELTQTISVLQRALDRTEGRLGVYEDFLVGTQTGSLRKMVSKYLQETNSTSETVSLSSFENWANSKYTPKTGMGGPNIPIGR